MKCLVRNIHRIRKSQGWEIDYTVPVIKCQEYSKEEIFEKKLYMLLPYYILRYEKRMLHLKKEESEEKLLKEELLEEYEAILNCMEQELLPKQAEAYLDLYQLMERVLDYVLRKNSKLKEEVKHIMGGKAMETYSQQLLREGRMEGRMEGRLGSLLELVRDGLLDLNVAAERAGMPLERFEEMLSEKQ